MSLSPPRLYNPLTDTALVASFAHIHAECITKDHTLSTFLPPLSHDKVLDSWTQWSDQVRLGSRDIIFLTAPASEGEGEEVAGVVSLFKPATETGPFRAEVQRLLVNPNHRYKGIARRLMEYLEQVARENERPLIMLDTTIGSGAEYVYPKLGYVEIGVIPKYGISPKDGHLADEVFFYKDLRNNKS